jgi:hypothetical protein
MMMVCSRCGVDKPDACFGGRKKQCRECVNEMARRKYAEDAAYAERKREETRRYIAAHHERYQWKNLSESARAAAASRKMTGRLRGQPGYKPARHDAHVRAYKLHLQMQLREARRCLVAERAADERSRAERRREAFNQRTERLSDGYVSRRLKKNMPALKGVKLPKELLDLERLRLMIVREVNSERTKR